MVSIVLIPWNNVYMNMRHFLSRCLSVVLHNIDPVGPQCVQLCLGHPFRGDMQFCQEIIGGFRHRILVFLRDDEQVALNERANIHKNKNVFIFVEHRCGDLLLRDFAKNAIIHDFSPRKPTRFRRVYNLWAAL